MASRRKLKKQIKDHTNLLIEDAFMESINGDEKEAIKMDSIIDEVIDERNILLNAVCAYPVNESRGKVKVHFSQVKTDLTARAAEYKKKIGRVG